jgi:hypothetical protein
MCGRRVLTVSCQAREEGSTRMLSCVCRWAHSAGGVSRTAHERISHMERTIDPPWESSWPMLTACIPGRWIEVARHVIVRRGCAGSKPAVAPLQRSQA